MNAFAISALAGFVVFVGVYSSFEYWFQRIWMPMSQLTDRTVEVADDLFLFMKRQDFLRIQTLVSGFFGGFVAFLFWALSPLLAIIIGGYVFYFAWRIPLLYLLNFEKPNRVGLLSVQMVDGLTLMANGLKAGLSVPQALEVVVREMPNPIKQEFGKVLNENQLGTALDVAFEGLSRRIGSEDVSMFVTSVNILSQTGGNQAETYQNIVKTIRERLKLQSKIQAMTAQGMTSAVIVSLLPWALGIMLYFIDPERMRPMFFHPAGWVILTMVLVLEVVGFSIIRWIVKIKV